MTSRQSSPPPSRFGRDMALDVKKFRLFLLYATEGQAEVEAFLDEDPALIDLLLDLHPKIVAVFPSPRVTLHMLPSRSAASSTTSHLLLEIVTPLPAREALDRLNRESRVWLSQADPQAVDRLLLDVSSSDVDSADDLDERYRQRFSTGNRTYLDTARRFLSAPPNSEERLVAGAELSSAIARPDGTPPPRRGGDPQEVLARLRRRRQVHDEPSDLR